MTTVKSIYTFEDKLADAERLIECQSQLAESRQSVVSACLATGNQFREWDHYPDSDVIDPETKAQYFYHAHAEPDRMENDPTLGENGHFHILMRNEAPSSNAYITPDTPALTHIIAISMDASGQPRALFTVNHWVTDGIYEPAAVVKQFLYCYEITFDHELHLVSKWICSLLRLFQDKIKDLLDDRDKALASYGNQGSKVYEDRSLEIISYKQISISDKLNELYLLEQKPVPGHQSSVPII